MCSGGIEALVLGDQRAELRREPNPTLVAADVQFGAENEADIKAWFADYSAQ